MRKLLCLALALTLLLFAAGTAAEEASISQAAADPDTVYRMELRLRELGYLSKAAAGLPSPALTAALSAFCAANSLADTADVADALFSREARPASNVDGTVPADKETVVTGQAIPWEQVRRLLSPGASYAVTACDSGAVLELVCTSLDGFADMVPARSWDAAMLTELMGDAYDLSKTPVVVTVDGLRVAASLQACPPGTGARHYGLFFTDGILGVGGIVDADHAATLAIAAAHGPWRGP